MTRRFSNQRTAAGISLVEMMIAMVIGLVLMLGVIQVFSASRTASMLAEGSARAQENGRFAMDFLQRDIRMAGHFGCVNDQAHFVRGEGDPAINTGAVSGSGHPLDFSISVQGYEAPNTKPPGTLTLGDTWAVPVNLPAAITKLNPRGGSDILVLRYLAPEGVPIKALTTGSDSVVGFDATAGLRLTEGGASGTERVRSCGLRSCHGVQRHLCQRQGHCHRDQFVQLLHTPKRTDHALPRRVAGVLRRHICDFRRACTDARTVQWR